MNRLTMSISSSAGHATRVNWAAPEWEGQDSSMTAKVTPLPGCQDKLSCLNYQLLVMIATPLSRFTMTVLMLAVI